MPILNAVRGARERRGMIVRNVHRVGPQIVTGGNQHCRDCGKLVPSLHLNGYRVGSYIELLDGHRVKQWQNPPPARRRCNAEPD